MRIGPSWREGSRVKPPGMPQIGPFGAPRGLVLCAPFAAPGFHAVRNLTNGTAVGGLAPAFVGATALLKPTLAGAGVQCIGSGSAFTVGYGTASLSTPFSMEVLFYSGSTLTPASICGFNNSNDGSNTTYDKTIAFSNAGQLSCYVFNGSPITITDSTTAYAPNTLYHAIAVEDGTNLILYLNGNQVATTSNSGSFNGYGSSAFFCVGGTHCNATAPDATFNCYSTILMANLYNAALTPAEVRGRARNPFGFLEWPDDWMMNFEAGTAVVGGGVAPFSISW